MDYNYKKETFVSNLTYIQEKTSGQGKGFTCGSYFVGLEREVSLGPKANDEIA